MDFCLRFEIPSGALPVGFEDFDFGLLAPDLAGPDFPFAPLPLVEGFEAAILERMRKVGEVGEKLQRLVCRKQRGMVLRNYVGGLGSC